MSDSRHNIKKKLESLEEQKNNGNITLEEYDTLRIRYERKLGNVEEVSRLQKAKGFKPSKIKESKAKKEEFYDDFVDGYSSVKSEEYSEITSKQVFSKKTKRIIIVLFVLLAFGIGLVAGISALHTIQNETKVNITVTDSAFSPNDTVVSADNLTQGSQNVTVIIPKNSSNTNDTNITSTKKTKTKTKTTKTSKKTSSSSQNSSSSQDSSSNKNSSG